MLAEPLGKECLAVQGAIDPSARGQRVECSSIHRRFDFPFGDKRDDVHFGVNAGRWVAVTLGN